MHSTFAKFPEQPAVDGAECQFALPGKFPGTIYMIKYPFDLGGGKISINNQSGFLPNAGTMTGLPDLVAIRCSPPVLPYNGIINGFTGFSVPYNGCFTLVGNSYGC